MNALNMLVVGLAQAPFLITCMQVMCWLMNGSRLIWPVHAESGFVDLADG